MNWSELESTYTKLPANFYDFQAPTPVAKPRWVKFNESLCNDLGLGSLDLKEDLLILSGNKTPEGINPFAQAYAGHQYGHFTILGDGRATVLGEHLTPVGARVDIQLKGSGPTKYSRRGDGRAALAPMLREYLISEYLYAVGIPTTRSLAVVSTGEDVLRDGIKPGAVLVRTASSHIRVGTFEYAAAIDPSGRCLESLLRYTAARHFGADDGEIGEIINTVIGEYCVRQAWLIAQWLGVGFVHGVMNTDNVSICGETLDLGPCAFMESLNPTRSFSSIDRNGRYAYANQPNIALWNTSVFATALTKLLPDDKSVRERFVEEAVENFKTEFEKSWSTTIRSKIGLTGSLEDGDSKLVINLLSWMEKYQFDFTQFFSKLCRSSELEIKEFFKYDEALKWYEEWKARLEKSRQEKNFYEDMRSKNPVIIPRNQLVESALSKAEVGELEDFENLLLACQNPFDEKLNWTEFADASSKDDQACYQTFCGT